MKTVVLPGGSGFLGRILAAHFAERDYQVVVLSRRPSLAGGPIRNVRWDGETLGDWAAEFEGAAAVVNLAGRTVNCRYHERNREEIYQSRLRSTRVVGEAVARCAAPPPVWINSASATIYRHAEDRPMDEETGEIGSGFSVDVCRKWEQTLWDAAVPSTRKVALRSALVLGKGRGGVMETFLRLVRLGLGGTMGSGAQFVSWVHAEDFTGAIQWLVERDLLDGPVNCASPNPVPNAEFMRTLRRACRQPIGLPAAAWMLEVGAVFLQTETELILKSRRVVPKRLLDAGFRFRYPELAAAVEQIVRDESTR